MDTITYNTALIVGAGVGLSAALTRLLTFKNIRVALAARGTDKLAQLQRNRCHSLSMLRPI